MRFPWARLARKRRLVIFGAGAYGASAYPVLAVDARIVAFVDNDPNKHGSTLYGVPICAPEALRRLAFDAVVIASDYRAEIHQQLTESLNISEARIEHFSSSTRAAGPAPRARLRDGLFSLGCALPHAFGPALLALMASLSGDFRKLRRVPIDWLDSHAAPTRKILEASRVAINPGPRYLDRPQSFAEITIPAQTMDVFDGAIISTASHGLRVGQRLFIERVPSTQPGAADFRSGKILHHSDRAALLRDVEPEAISRGIAIFGYNATNYYHIVIEALTKLAHLDAVSGELAHAPLLMPVSFSQIPSVRDLIEYLAPGREIAWLANNREYRVDRLVWISSPNLWVANLNSGYRYTPAECFVRTESVAYLRSVLAQPRVVKACETATPRRIYLARKGGLRSYNQDELLPLFSSNGFVPVYMEDHSLEEQIALFCNAERIVGPTGAAWTNLVFAKAGARALSWIAEEHGDASCYSILAASVGVEMDFLSYSAGTEDTRRIYSMPYRLPPERVTAWLEQVE